MGASNFPGLALPKPAPRFKVKAAKVSAEQKAIRGCYALVDARDSHCCRACRKRVGGIGLLYAAHHHHLVSRSVAGKAVKHETKNVVTLCAACHDAVENSGLVRLTGNADERNSVGVLCGLHLERATDAGWRTVGWR